MLLSAAYFGSMTHTLPSVRAQTGKNIFYSLMPRCERTKTTRAPSSAYPNHRPRLSKVFYLLFKSIHAPKETAHHTNSFSHVCILTPDITTTQSTQGPCVCTATLKQLITSESTEQKGKDTTLFTPSRDSRVPASEKNLPETAGAHQRADVNFIHIDALEILQGSNTSAVSQSVHFPAQTAGAHERTHTVRPGVRQIILGRRALTTLWPV